ncbi:hypothetical protein [Aliihoeflea sp. PC F10.4]
MKFKLADTHTYWWPIKVKMPDPDQAGKVLEFEFSMQFESVPLDQARAEDKAIAELAPAEQTGMRLDQMMKRCRGWRDVVGDDGGDIPFNETNLSRAMQSSWFRMGVFRAFDESLVPGEARRGN